MNIVAFVRLVTGTAAVRMEKRRKRSSFTWFESRLSLNLPRAAEALNFPLRSITPMLPLLLSMAHHSFTPSSKPTCPLANYGIQIPKVIQVAFNDAPVVPNHNNHMLVIGGCRKYDIEP